MKDVIVRFEETQKELEIYFPTLPDPKILSQLKEGTDRFFWDPKKGCWHGGNTPKRVAFIEQVLGNHYHVQFEYDVDMVHDKKKNRIADYYDSVGEDRIYYTSSVKLQEFMDADKTEGSAYFADTNLYISLDRRDFIRVIDLTNAHVSGDFCAGYDLCFKDAKKHNVLNYLLKECGIETVKDLYGLIKTSKDLGDLMIDKIKYPSERIYSPFYEGVPLTELPKHWTKETLLCALLSGQVAGAVTIFELSGKPDIDMLTNAMHGAFLELPALGRSVVMAYDGGLKIRSGSLNDKEALVIITDHDSSKMIHVNLDYNIKKGKIREIQQLLAQEQLRNEKKGQVIDMADIQIDEDKVYKIEYLIEEANTKQLYEKKGLIQGRQLKKRLEQKEIRLQSLREEQIHLDKLYQVSSFVWPVKLPTEDERLLLLGNNDILVSGKGLLELSKDMDFLHIIDNPFCGNTFEDAKIALESFIEGQKYWGVKDIDYGDWLNRIEKEKIRCTPVLSRNTENLTDKTKRKAAVDFKDLDDMLMHVSRTELNRKRQKENQRTDRRFER